MNFFLAEAQFDSKKEMAYNVRVIINSINGAWEGDAIKVATMKGFGGIFRPEFWCEQSLIYTESYDFDKPSQYYFLYSVFLKDFYYENELPVFDFENQLKLYFECRLKKWARIKKESKKKNNKVLHPDIDPVTNRLMLSAIQIHGEDKCPKCGSAGKFVRMALVCDKHGMFGGC